MMVIMHPVLKVVLLVFYLPTPGLSQLLLYVLMVEKSSVSALSPLLLDIVILFGKGCIARRGKSADCDLTKIAATALRKVGIRQAYKN